ncbi:MAG: methyltransferase domain-containing protein [Dehalococcoidia bacterium]|nr:methyltransferase domain-containing protein [Dehalococcoidia bacterium]
MAESPLQPQHFRRYDEADDAEFYRVPRMVTHIDDAAIEAVRRFYGDLLPRGECILDLMSSWVSHLPDDGRYASVTGLGMNAEELAANAQLAHWVVQDLNREAELPFDDGAFGGAVVTVSVQYLTRPVEVFAEVGRVLRARAPFAVTFSNRCFPTKAVAAWQMLDDAGHAELVRMYFRLSKRFGPSEVYDLSPDPGVSDPVYAVVAGRLSY